MAFKFTYDNCLAAANNLSTSAEDIQDNLNNFGNSINSVANNYKSATATDICDKFTDLQKLGPDFVEAVEACADYLRNTVAPAYKELEEKAGSKIENFENSHKTV